jgi:hypothetical protein
VLPFGTRNPGREFLNYAAKSENVLRPNLPSTRLSRCPAGVEPPQRCSNVRGGILNSTAAPRRDFSLQAAISQFSGNHNALISLQRLSHSKRRHDSQGLSRSRSALSGCRRFRSADDRGSRRLHPRDGPRIAREADTPRPACRSPFEPNAEATSSTIPQPATTRPVTLLRSPSPSFWTLPNARC